MQQECANITPVSPRLCVAPMMAWTDRHCRYLHRLYSPNALLFTEMVTTGALLHGQQWQLLKYNEEEHPVALQLGGSDPSALAQCAREAERQGYDEVNLNVGCPSDRVQKGTFGACLMRNPELVAQCVEAMGENTTLPISVKCRLGVDDDDSDELLLAFIDRVSAGGCHVSTYTPVKQFLRVSARRKIDRSRLYNPNGWQRLNNCAPIWT